MPADFDHASVAEGELPDAVLVSVSAPSRPPPIAHNALAIAPAPDEPRLNPSHMARILAGDGLTRQDSAFLIRAYDGLGPLISGPRCSPATLLRVDDLTQSSLWLAMEYGAPTGALLLAALNEAGAAAAQAGQFNPLDPDSAHLCLPNGRLGAWYGWLFAGATPSARRRVLRGARRVCDGEFGAVPIYARAATAKGAATLDRLGFIRRPGADQYLKLSAQRPDADLAPTSVSFADSMGTAP